MGRPAIALRLTVSAATLTLAGLTCRAGAPQAVALPLDSLERLETVNTKADIVTYRGRKALHLTPPQNPKVERGSTTPDMERDSMIALVKGSDFKDGTIEAEVAGVPITAMDDTARGFIGIVFRAQDHGARAENIYIRPTNGRAEDQLRRNHSTQYESIPDFPWHRLRKEAPGVYESFVDLEAGAWTKLKIEVRGAKARLYVNGTEQPCLIVNDLKLGDVHGQVGLWAFIATDGYFSNLKVTPVN